MKMVLISKNKMKFLDGSIPIPDEYDPTFPVWQCYNTMLLSWISRPVFADITKNVILSYRYVNRSIAHLLQEIHSLKQGIDLLDLISPSSRYCGMNISPLLVFSCGFNCD